MPIPVAYLRSIGSEVDEPVVVVVVVAAAAAAAAAAVVVVLDLEMMIHMYALQVVSLEFFDLPGTGCDLSVLDD